MPQNKKRLSQNEAAFFTFVDKYSNQTGIGQRLLVVFVICQILFLKLISKTRHFYFLLVWKK